MIQRRYIPVFIFYFFFINIWLSCTSHKIISIPKNSVGFTGTEFYKLTSAYNWKQRDSVAVKLILNGNVPKFLRRFVPVEVALIDTASGKKIKATYFVSTDYLSIGTDKDWARINITPMAAQKIADSFDCFLPTRKMVNDIYHAADVKLSPVPMFAFRDSTPTMFHHHLIIEGQRQMKLGLIAGIKKDVVISEAVVKALKENRVAIYGWHQSDGKPIQPLYAGHVNWYVDYSHGVRLIYQKLKVNNKWMNYTDVLKDPVLRKLLCDETECNFYKYSY